MDIFAQPSPMTLIGSGLWVTTTISMIARQLQVFVRFSRITIMMTNLLFYMPVKLVDQEILVLSPSKTFRRFEHVRYTEMLGWISSIVMRKNLFINALQKTHERGQLSRNDHALGVSHSAFFQASYFYEELHMKKGAFIDKQLVEPQDEEMTEETRERWQAENMEERYIYIVDDLEIRSD